MKMRWVLLPMAALTVAAVLYGGYTRTTLTDYTSGENWKDNFTIASLHSGKGVERCEVMREYLPLAPNILRVEVLGDLEVLPGEAQQKVKVKQVYAGEDLQVGQEFYLYERGWSISFVEPYSIERGFVNVMDVGREYLVFVSKEIDTLDSSLPVYQSCSGVESSTGEWVRFSLSPVFCYDHIDNAVAIPSGIGGTALPYAQVKDNEFFGTTPEVVEAWEQLKAEMLQKYPR
ncbi:hypothetical protein H9X86_03735 [Pseudoflavonifractor capillosus]|uniref:hypothetical protein n=1 Tax=Pseudoflavonifractor capillosus TaxID=106588 RepID=UPI00195EBEAC|nr:hypothetical protein [Pseudoflavonifractor capillosus]MBM6896481.1 hypothetical protein [Pseudoflavonifractor capillosus]